MKNQDGQATLELALCLPFVAMLLAVVVEIGGVANDRTRLWHAAREAARVAAVDPDMERIESAARSSHLEGIEVEVSPGSHERVQGEPIAVSVAYSPGGRVPLIGELFSGLRLTSEATMRIERP